MHWITKLDGCPRRVNHAAVAINDKIYSFGGYCAGENFSISGIKTAIDVYVFDTKTLRWHELPVPRNKDGSFEMYPDVPYKRYGHTAVAYKNCVYMWGGRNDEALCSNLYRFDVKTLQWEHITTKGVKPEARDGHSASIIGNKMYIFGGYIEGLRRYSQDLYCLNLDTMVWKYVNTTGKTPEYRDFHSSVIIDNKLYIFGGRSDVSAPRYTGLNLYDSTMYILNLDTKKWETARSTGQIPIGRRSASMFVYKDMIYIFGGYNSRLGQHFDDLYKFNPRLHIWTKISAKGESPAIRRRQVCIVIDTKMYLFGGSSPKYEAELFSMQDRQFVLRNYISPDDTYNDTYVLDFEPTLETLAMLVVIKHKLDISQLPRTLRFAFFTMTKPNTVSKRLPLSSG